MLEFENSQGLEIHIQNDLPARTGIGSSSSFSVGLIRALMTLRGFSITKHDLALQAIKLEQELLKEDVGSQDQIAAAYGGINLINFETDGEIKINPIKISNKRLRDLEQNLLLLYTGNSRLGSEISRDIIKNLSNKQRELSEMHKLVHSAIDILYCETNLKKFGELLHQAWIIKRDLSKKVSNEEIDMIYQIALNNGAIGGKLLGAGARGFMLFFVPVEKQELVKKSLPQYIWIPFRFENSGSTIIKLSPI